MSRWPRAGGRGGGAGGLEGVLPHMAYTGMCRWQGMVFDLSVPTGYTISCESVNRVLLARLVSFAGSILYNTKELTMKWICCNVFTNTAACILSFELNRVVKLRVFSQRGWYFRIFFRPKKGQSFKASGALIYQNISQVTQLPPSPPLRGSLPMVYSLVNNHAEINSKDLVMFCFNKLC